MIFDNVILVGSCISHNSTTVEPEKQQNEQPQNFDHRMLKFYI